MDLEQPEISASSQLPNRDTNKEQLFSLLHKTLNWMPACRIRLWHFEVLNFIKKWKPKSIHLMNSSKYLQRSLENLISLVEHIANAKSCDLRVHHCTVCLKNGASSQLQQVNDATPPTANENKMDESNVVQESDGSYHLPQPATLSSASHQGSSINSGNSDMTNLSSADKEQMCSSDTLKEGRGASSPSKILVLVAPSREMAAQLMAPENGESQVMWNFFCVFKTDLSRV